jgi:hypothetical protein
MLFFVGWEMMFNKRKNVKKGTEYFFFQFKFNHCYYYDCGIIVWVLFLFMLIWFKHKTHDIINSLLKKIRAHYSMRFICFCCCCYYAVVLMINLLQQLSEFYFKHYFYFFIIISLKIEWSLSIFYYLWFVIYMSSIEITFFK